MSIARMSRQKERSAARDAFLLLERDGFGSARFIWAGLNLNESHGLAARRDDVNFALRRFVAIGEDSVKLKMQNQTA